MFPLKDPGPRCQGEPAAPLRLADESPTVIFRCGQSPKVLTSSAAVASDKPRAPGMTAVIRCPDHTRLYACRYVRLIRFSFLILIAGFATLDAWFLAASHPCIIR